MSEIIIGGKKIGPNHPPFIIAEMSGNHNQSLPRAIAIVEAAAAAGADAIKLQTYTADTMTIDAGQASFNIRDAKSLWNGNSLYELYKKAYTPWEWHRPIMDRCKELGLVCFSSPFDESAVDFLEGLNVPAYKIASFENNHLPLIRRAASTGKPLIISTGMASIAELDDVMSAALDAGCREIILLKCTSTYPSTPENSNLRTIAHMKDLFRNAQIGLSDHTMGIGAAIAGVAMGAIVIEKHFTLKRSDGGVDSAFSMEPDELKALVVESRAAWSALGSVSYGPTENERPSMQYRRSVYIVRDVKEGEEFTPDNLRIIRPGFGLAPKFYEVALGKRAKKAVEKGTPLSWDLLA